VETLIWQYLTCGIWEESKRVHEEIWGNKDVAWFDNYKNYDLLLIATPTFCDIAV